MVKLQKTSCRLSTKVRMPTIILLFNIALKFPTKGIIQNKRGRRVGKKKVKFSLVEYMIIFVENSKEPSDNF